MKTVDFAVNVQHTYKGDVPSKLERASVTFNDDGSIRIVNRTGAELNLANDAAVALAILLKAELLKPVPEERYGARTCAVQI